MGRSTKLGARRKSSRTLGEQAIFGDEDAAELRLEIDALRALVNELSSQVHAQFTTISAHAEIARQQADFVREEARADLERTRSMMLELVDRARSEMTPPAGIHVTGTVPGPSVVATNERFEELEQRVAAAVAGIDRCFDRQRVLADTIEALLDTMVADQTGVPAVGLSLV